VLFLTTLSTLGLQPELKKCFQEGKSIIIEGIHVTDSLYSFICETWGLDKQDPSTATNSIIVGFNLQLEDERSHHYLLEQQHFRKYLTPLTDIHYNHITSLPLYNICPFTHPLESEIPPFGTLTSTPVSPFTTISIPYNPDCPFKGTLEQMHQHVLQSLQLWWHRQQVAK
jgi:hypothetical protein